MTDGGRLTLQASVSIDSFQSFLSTRERGVSNRHSRTLGTAQGDDLGVEFRFGSRSGCLITEKARCQFRSGLSSPVAFEI